ncbi:MAG: mercury methylation corrinoid protein HgcA [Acidobacteriota bacterium]
MDKGCSCCKNKNKADDIKRVSPILNISDITGGWKARWNIGRLKYTVKPGLYKIGDPLGDSEVFVTANYKMSFDRLRKNLKGINAWILVLETFGINVWCAAGKGTFGTDELVNRINKAGLKNMISHQRLIVPQLGAPGIAAHEVKKRSGFNVIYGPVRAVDIPGFLKNGLKKDPEMRKVTFTFLERLVLTPVEFVKAIKFFPIIVLILFLINKISGNSMPGPFYRDLLIYFGAFVSGTVLFPILLPFLPFRSFALKGWQLGIVYSVITNLIFYGSALGNPAGLFIIPVLVSFLSYNFTGSSTYTSLSGVEKELKLSLPLYGFSILSGIIVLLIKTFQG